MLQREPDPADLLPDSLDGESLISLRTIDTAMLGNMEGKLVVQEWQASNCLFIRPFDTGLEIRSGGQNCLVHWLLREIDHPGSGSDVGPEDGTK